VLNATQAMAGGGIVLVRVRRAAGVAGAPDSVEIAVHDSGVGIPKERLDRALEPYFTTKRKVTGSGSPSAIRSCRSTAGRWPSTRSRGEVLG
jgi:signal transduction histidine kinase